MPETVVENAFTALFAASGLPVDFDTITYRYICMYSACNDEADQYEGLDSLLSRQARIGEELRDMEGLERITALRGPAISELIEKEVLRLSLFDRGVVAQIVSPDTRVRSNKQ